MMDELQSLTQNIDHIKTIVAMQQSYAGVAGRGRDGRPGRTGRRRHQAELRLLRKIRHRSGSRVRGHARRFASTSRSVLQILVNLVTNAKDALIESGAERPPPDGPHRACDRRATMRRS